MSKQNNTPPAGHDQRRKRFNGRIEYNHILLAERCNVNDVALALKQHLARERAAWLGSHLPTHLHRKVISRLDQM